MRGCLALHKASNGKLKLNQCHDEHVNVTRINIINVFEIAQLLTSPDIDRLPFQQLADPDPQKGLARIADPHTGSDRVGETQYTGAEPVDVVIETMIKFGR